MAVSIELTGNAVADLHQISTSEARYSVTFDMKVRLDTGLKLPMSVVSSPGFLSSGTTTAQLLVFCSTFHALSTKLLYVEPG